MDSNKLLRRKKDVLRWINIIMYIDTRLSLQINTTNK